MKTKIGVPENPAYNYILQDIEEVRNKFNVEIYKLPENQLTKLMLENKLQMALINPLIYSKIFKSSDYRIMNDLCICSVGYTGISVLNLHPNSLRISKILSNYVDDFFLEITKLLVSERYDQFPTISTFDKDYELKPNEAIVSYNDLNSQLDVSEDWYESYEIPLVYGFWIIRNEEEPENSREIVKNLAKDNFQKEIPIALPSNEYNREGAIITYWDDDIKNSLNQIYELLFAAKIIDDIPELKFTKD